MTSLLTKLNSPSDVWIGIQYNPSSQQYQWINNAPVTYTKWFNRQPNPALGSFSKVGVNTGLQPMLWRAAKGNEELPFFCQRRTGKHGFDDLSMKRLFQKYSQSKGILA